MASLKNLQKSEMDSELQTLRHSCAHVMAHAVLNLWPQARFGIGPTIENGFYYDIDLDHTVQESDLKKIEKEMKKIIQENNPFIREVYEVEKAKELFQTLKQPFKLEIIDALEKEQNEKKVIIYREGTFVDLCRGPHIERTGKIQHFQLLSVAGAYWRGDETKAQLQRIYGTAFFTKKELKKHLIFLEEAKKRDHRKLGKELGWFSFHQEAPGAPFFHPKGATVYRLLVEYMRKWYVRYGYQEVITPQVLDLELWKRSGHYDHYFKYMYIIESEKRAFALKPMNCPTHALMYAEKRHSYRELPIRFADFGRLHRFERSGAVGGLTRVRSFAQDDAHIFCTPDQIEKETETLIEMILKTYAFFQFQDVNMKLSTRPESFVGEKSLWDQAEKSLEQVLKNKAIPYQIDAGEGAFYGPKIDFFVKDAIGRQHQLATIQLDFNLPRRFELSYIGADNESHPVVMIHRAVLGSIERFMAVLIEHFGAAVPFWLAPQQARFLPIQPSHIAYCETFARTLREHGYRVGVDARSESLGLKTREVQIEKVPFSLVAGEREVQAGTFSVRRYGEKKSETMTQDALFVLFKKLQNEFQPL